MYYFRLLLEILLFFASAYYFAEIFRGKIKLYRIRFKMQEEGLLRNINITWITFLSLLFWFFPITRYNELGDIEHNKQVKSINKSMLMMLLFLVILFIAI